MRPAPKIFTPPPPDGDAITARRRRTQRLPLPASVAELTLTEEPELLNVDAFLDRLVELPLSTWLTIGAELMADRDGLVVRQRAWSDVEAAIARFGLGITVWHLRDAVHTAAYLVSRHISCWSREERCRFAATHGAADAAAASLLAHAHIPVECLRVLYRPFAASIDPNGRTCSSTNASIAMSQLPFSPTDFARRAT